MYSKSKYIIARSKKAVHFSTHLTHDLPLYLFKYTENYSPLGTAIENFRRTNTLVVLCTIQEVYNLKFFM